MEKLIERLTHLHGSNKTFPLGISLIKIVEEELHVYDHLRGWHKLIQDGKDLHRVRFEGKNIWREIDSDGREDALFAALYALFEDSFATGEPHNYTIERDWRQYDAAFKQLNLIDVL